MMGIRVWDGSGRRLHFHGTPINYDSLSVFRHPRKRICTQDPTQRPDLWVQIEAGTYDERTNVDSSRNQQEDRVASRTMPWDVKMPVPEMASEGLSILSRVRLAWIASRYENARSSYSREKFLEYEAYGGKRIRLEDLTHSELPSNEANFIGPYPEIGVDSPYISIRYPPTKVSLISENGEEVEATNELCALCATLDFKDLFECGILDVDIDFGSTEDLMSLKDCNFCRGLSILCEDGLDHLARYMQNPQLDRSHAKFNLAHSIKVSVVRNPILCRSTKPFVVLTQSSQKEYLGPIVSLRTIRGDIRGEYKLERNRCVNLNLIKQMVERCSASHGANCGQKKTNNEKDQSALIFIDVKNMCLVELEEAKVDYITLSYVWGNKPMLKTTTENFPQLLNPGSLLDVQTSRLVKDAAKVVSALGLQHLWIDALCIIQDDEVHKMTQIQRMADIYGQSYLTIVALTGVDSSCGLPGISQLRPQTIEVVDGMPITFDLSGLSFTAHNQIYEQRGWTYQERLTSSRCLFFSDRQVFFECGRGSTSDQEAILPPNDRGRYGHAFNTFNKMVGHLNKTPMASLHDPELFSHRHLETFCQIVSRYTSRNLTFQSDIENAFLGIENVITSRLGWIFAAGMPTGVFDWALLWLPHGQLQRRTLLYGFGEVSTFSPPS